VCVCVCVCVFGIPPVCLHRNNIMKQTSMLLLLTLASLTSTNGFAVVSPIPASSTNHRDSLLLSTLHMSSTDESNSNLNINNVDGGDLNPCWQDIYDDDCSMSNIYAASFVASKWIKSLPCGAGIRVRKQTDEHMISTESIMNGPNTHPLI